MSISHQQNKTETMAYLHEHYTYESFYWKKMLLSILKLKKWCQNLLSFCFSVELIAVIIQAVRIKYVKRIDEYYVPVVMNITYRISSVIRRSVFLPKQSKSSRSVL